jgi:DNA polymerase V
MPTNYTADLASIAAVLLRQIHRPGFLFRKVGVLLSDLHPETETQLSFAGPSPETVARRRTLMATLDRLNATLGRGTLRLGSTGPADPVWKMRQAHLSPCFTTRWGALLTVRA